ncbi:hypothetical protein LOTGIDRAFT_117619 [Lottia gigantea]|uniref:ubiquitinyl hydrolase 1 n=1 Tax=Lottia gigantea TaxID=225164 RepID=V4AJT5_LOTGI|nr:hypothetical protein LOTGIDRAFT_117619 [Lottia gigantea]ESO94985.1 hypothetical protein LOTGIDRAFT_117619 [Lottia gigantea]
MDDENVSDGSIEEETILERHRREKKELLAEITKIRHSSKSDKKKKKESQEQIARLENELKERHEREIEEDKTNQSELGDDQAIEPQESAEVTKLKKKMAKAQKRRDNKAAKNRERDAALKQQEIDNLTGKRHLEIQKIKQLLAKKKLKIFEIPSDGNCLYNAVSHQMQNEHNAKLTNNSLRRQTADYMKSNEDNFIPFLTRQDTGDCYTHEEYEKYCEDIANTSAWAGHLEIQAISSILNCRIEIVQSEGSPIILGEEYTDNFTLVLPYHRHIYGLGEHYNSVEPISGSDEVDQS